MIKFLLVFILMWSIAVLYFIVITKDLDE